MLPSASVLSLTVIVIGAAVPLGAAAAVRCKFAGHCVDFLGGAAAYLDRRPVPG